MNVAKQRMAQQKPAAEPGKPRLSALEALDRKGKLFYPNPLDAPKGTKGMEDYAKTESLMYSDQMMREIMRGKGYIDFGTPLEGYCFPLAGFDLPSHLSGLAEKAAQQGRRLRMLDVGVGPGKQWLEFLAEHAGSVEFHAVALSDEYVEPALRCSLTICAAAGMAHEFPEGYFDVIVSRSGMHRQAMAGIIAIERLLKPGGEAVITGHRDTMPEPDEIAANCPRLSMLCAASSLAVKAVAYHFRKI